MLVLQLSPYFCLQSLAHVRSAAVSGPFKVFSLVETRTDSSPWPMLIISLRLLVEVVFLCLFIAGELETNKKY